MDYKGKLVCCQKQISVHRLFYGRFVFHNLLVEVLKFLRIWDVMGMRGVSFGLKYLILYFLRMIFI